MLPENITLVNGPKGHYWMNFDFTKDFGFTAKYIEVPMYITVQSNNSHVVAGNNITLAPYSYKSKEGLILYVTEYLVDNLIHYLNSNNLLNVGVITNDTDLMITMSTIQLALGLFSPPSGFSSKGKCTYNLTFYEGKIRVMSDSVTRPDA